MERDDFEEILHQVTSAAENGSYQLALTYLSQAGQYSNHPVLQSYRAYCAAVLTSDKRKLLEAVKLCQDSMQRDGSNSIHYLLQGRILMFLGDRKNAIKTFQTGLKISPNPGIIAEVKRIGMRKNPVFDGLERSHPLNYCAGKLFSRLGLR